MSVALKELLPETERREGPSVAEVAGMSLERFARAGLVLKVRSSLFDEVVVFASDNAQVPNGERRAVYRAADLDRLLRGRGRERTF
jgi:hypothetical protein